MSVPTGSNDITPLPQSLSFAQAPQRVVSLVPSLTESLFDLGFGSAVAGVTDYCIHPADALKDMPRVGGTKTPRVGDILALSPDLVLANWEENTRQTVEALQAAGIPVWVTLPLSVREAVDLLHTLATLFRSPEAELRVRMLDLTLDWTIHAALSGSGVRYFCPIWHEVTPSGQPWWMTFNRRTYCHDLLEVCGGKNVFADRERLYPLNADLGQEEPRFEPERDTRYPRVTLNEIIAAQPEVILIPDDPYQFSDAEVNRLASWLGDTPAARLGRIRRTDGSLITWAGTRTARALQELPAIFE